MANASNGPVFWAGSFTIGFEENLCRLDGSIFVFARRLDFKLTVKGGGQKH